MICPVCEKNTKVFLPAVVNSKSIVSAYQISSCKSCGILIREIENNDLSKYFIKSVYTDIANESDNYCNRIKFLEYIFSLALQYKNTIVNWLDYGSSYGHLLALLNDNKVNGVGIEVSDEVQHYTQNREFEVYKMIEDLPANASFSVISLIDSFYYSPSPKSLLKEIYGVLDDDGLLIIRIVNRNLRKKTCTALVDHTVGFSKQSIRILLKQCGFEILKTIYFEKGKRRSAKVKCFYLTSLFLYITTFGLINIVPGYILIIRKKLD
jgi:SAM-dependent methyltransferase